MNTGLRNPTILSNVVIIILEPLSIVEKSTLVTIYVVNYSIATFHPSAYSLYVVRLFQRS